MTPRVEGEVHLFAEHGLYDGLFLMRDEQTGTFWDHMTGEAVYGPRVGTTLEVANLRQTTPRQLLREDPDALIALSGARQLRRDEDLKLDGLLGGVRNRLNRFFTSTVEREDDRRPTMDLGLGIWGGDQAIYYPYDTISERGGAVLDRYSGRGMVVYLDPTAYTLVAFHTEADGFEWDDDVLRLSDGSYVEGGVFFGASGERLANRRPLQVFTRWYGFSLTFPGVPIYGQGG